MKIKNPILALCLSTVLFVGCNDPNQSTQTIDTQPTPVSISETTEKTTATPSTTHKSVYPDGVTITNPGQYLADLTSKVIIDGVEFHFPCKYTELLEMENVETPWWGEEFGLEYKYEHDFDYKYCEGYKESGRSFHINDQNIGEIWVLYPEGSNFESGIVYFVSIENLDVPIEIGGFLAKDLIHMMERKSDTVFGYDFVDGALVIYNDEFIVTQCGFKFTYLEDELSKLFNNI